MGWDWLGLAAAAAGILVCAAAAARGMYLMGVTALVMALAAGAVAAPWARRHGWIWPLLFWMALSIPLVKHLGRGEGLPAINADHVVLYPVDFVMMLWAAAAAVAAFRDAALTSRPQDLARALGSFLRPDLVGWGIIALAAAAVASVAWAPRPVLVYVGLVDFARWYLAYALFRRAAAAGGSRPIVGAFLGVAAFHALLCVIEFALQNNFGLWEKPGFGAYVFSDINLKALGVNLARGGGTYESNITAQFLQMALPFAAALALAAPGRARRILGLALVFLAAAGIFFTFSRGGWIGAGAAFALVLVFAWTRRRATGTSVGLATGLTALAAVVILPAIPVLFIARTMGDAAETSSASRFYDWGTALTIIRDHLLLGVGRGNYVAVAQAYTPWAFAYPVHNVYLWTWAETGILGIAAFGVFLAGAFRGAARTLARGDAMTIAFGAAGVAAMVGVCLRMFVSMSFVHPFVVLTFLALAAAAGAAVRDGN